MQCFPLQILLRTRDGTWGSREFPRYEENRYDFSFYFVIKINNLKLACPLTAKTYDSTMRHMLLKYIKNYNCETILTPFFRIMKGGLFWQ